MGKSEVFDTIFSIMEGCEGYLSLVCRWLLSQFHPGINFGKKLGAWNGHMGMLSISILPPIV